MDKLRTKFPWQKRATGSDRRPKHQEHYAQQYRVTSGGDRMDSGQQPASNPAECLDGVVEFHSCDDAQFDICFVHGLTGNRYSTWVAKGQSMPWPKVLLPTKLQKARILSYGYDAYVVRKSVVSRNELGDHAKNLLTDLTTYRAVEGGVGRPLVFVAHSLGGLVCKDAILLSRNNAEAHLQDVFNSVRAIAFMGTPHRGSWMANWANLPASAFGFVKSTNKSLLKVLMTDDTYLQSVQDRFWGMIREQQNSGREIKVTCFFEELPLPMLGLVVTKESATLEGYHAITIHGNHSDMVKFASGEDNGFKRLLGELLRWQTQIDQPHGGLSLLAQEYRDCLQSLAFAQMNDRYNDIAQGTAGTCEWLVQHETYKRWAASDRSLLWLKGKPGSGKSTLLRDLLNRLKATSDIRNGTLILSFFFHGRGTELQRTPLGLFRSLLHQLQDVSHALSGVVSKFKRQCQTMGIPGQNWEWHRSELQDSFEIALVEALTSTPVLLLVDALDECGENDARELVKVFVSLLKKHTSTESKELRICFTCRHYPVLSLDHVFEIWAEKENDADISVFVNSELSTSSAGKSSKIPDLITSRANGIFLWAYLVVKQVLNLELEGAGLETMKAAILSVPGELDKLYSELIQRMGDDSLRLIQWICFALRPLSVDEMRWALLIQAGHRHRTLDEQQKLGTHSSNDGAMKRQIQTLSCGLAEVTSDAKVVQFIHQSVKDFFCQKGLSALAVNSSSADIKNSHNHVEGFAHYELSRTCLHYLPLVDSCEVVNTRIHYPLLEYAATSWVEHAKHSTLEGNYQVDILQHFEWPSERLVRNWVQLSLLIPTSSSCRPEKGTRMIHLLSRYGLEVPFLAAAQSKNWINTEIDAEDAKRRTALIYAAADGHNSIVKLLLSKNAKIEAVDKNNRNALFYATTNGHDIIVQLLLENGADIDRPTGRLALSNAARNGHRITVKLLLEKFAVAQGIRDFGSSLLYAAMSGHDSIVKMLLENGASNKARGENGRSALSFAAEEGHNAIVKLLLIDGADVGATDENCRTALSFAAANGQNDTITHLLSHGVSIDEVDEFGRSALCYAGRNGHSDTVQHLLSYNAYIEAKDASSHTVLCYAAMRDHAAVVQLLLDMGANIDSMDMHGRSPLSHAAENGHCTVLKHLLDRGANYKAQDSNGGTVLHYAVKSGRYDSVHHLLNLGANIEAKDKHGRTMLCYAANFGHDAVAKLLVSKGANREAIDEDCRTPLFYAAQNGHYAVIKHLLKEGANIEAEDKQGQTALWQAVNNVDQEMVTFLVSRGAIIDHNTSNGRTQLSYAAEEGNQAVVQLLVRNGASVQSVDDLGRTSLSWAAEKGCRSVVLLLPSHGADPQLADRRGQTPLWYAAVEGRADIVQLFLDMGIEPKWTDGEGGTLLRHAVWGGSEDILQALIDRGANINLVDELGRTLLSSAAEEGHDSAVRLLLEHGADTNIAELDGRTPLLWAAIKGQASTLTQLLDSGADVEFADEHGRTALSFAAWKGHHTLVKQLLDNGADVNTTDKMGRTPLWYAEWNGSEDMMRLLLDKGAEK